MASTPARPGLGRGLPRRALGRPARARFSSAPGLLARGSKAPSTLPNASASGVCADGGSPDVPGEKPPSTTQGPRRCGWPDPASTARALGRSRPGAPARNPVGSSCFRGAPDRCAGCAALSALAREEGSKTRYRHEHLPQEVLSGLCLNEGHGDGKDLLHVGDIDALAG